MRRLALACVFSLLACGPASSSDDAGLDDAGVNDAGLPDAGPQDAGTPDAGSPDAGRTDAGLPDAGTIDAGLPDAGSLDAGPVLACLGTSLALSFPTRSPYVQATLAGSTGSFLIDYASNSSWVDVAAFSPRPTPVSCTGTVCDFASFDFFGPWGQVTFVEADFSNVQVTPKQAGIIGTDFLSVAPFTLDPAHGLFFDAKSTFCTDTELKNAGYVALDTAGFFSSNVANLVPMSTVQDGGMGLVPNVPTVTVSLAGVTARAQLDTGFDDSVVHDSVNVNQAFYDAVVAANPNVLSRVSSLDLTLTTCTGTNEPVTAYRLLSGNALSLVDSSGALVHPNQHVTIYVKHTPADARVCGGIGTWTVPAAQLSASLLHDVSAVAFDPKTSRVWVK